MSARGSACNDKLTHPVVRIESPSIDSVDRSWLAAQYLASRQRKSEPDKDWV